MSGFEDHHLPSSLLGLISFQRYPHGAWRNLCSATLEKHQAQLTYVIHSPYLTASLRQPLLSIHFLPQSSIGIASCRWSIAFLGAITRPILTLVQPKAQDLPFPGDMFRTRWLKKPQCRQTSVCTRSYS